MKRSVIAALAIAVVTFSACSRDEAPAATPDAPVPVSTYTLEPEPLNPVTTYASRIQAFENAALVARIEARVLERHVEGGETIAKGDVLLSLDPTDALLALAQARAAVTTAEAQLAEAERNFERGTRLSETGAIAAIELDKLTTDLEAAKAAVETARAARDSAEVNLSYAKVVAPIDGTVGLVNVSVGDLVGPDSGPVATITRQDTVLVDIEVSENDALTYAQRTARGERLEFRFDLELSNGTMYDHPGTLFSTANAANPATGTITARIAYPNPDDILTAGQSVRVHMSEPSASGRLAVPQAAVQQDQRGAYVMLVGDGMRVSQRHVALGEQVGEWWLLEDGLRAGDTIVTQGLQKITSGSVVSPVPAQ